MSEYSPKEIRVNLNDKTALVAMAKRKDVEEFMQKFNEFIMYNYPKFAVGLHEQNVSNPNMQGQQGNPYNQMMNQFSNMSMFSISYINHSFRP